MVVIVDVRLLYVNAFAVRSMISGFANAAMERLRRKCDDYSGVLSLEAQ